MAATSGMLTTNLCFSKPQFTTSLKPTSSVSQFTCLTSQFSGIKISSSQLQQTNYPINISVKPAFQPVAPVFITSEDERIQLTDDQKQEQKTPVDENGDGNPEWNYPMKFDLKPLNFIDPDYRNLCLVFELRNQGQLLFGDKVVGDVRVRLKDLIQTVGNEFVRFVSYEVRNPEDKHNGILDFSYKVISDVNTGVSFSNQDVQITGYHHYHHHEFDGCREQQHQQLNEDYRQSTNSEIHMIGDHHHHHNSNHLDESVSFSDSEKIQYPKIDLEEYNDLVVSAPPSVYPPLSSLSSSSSSLVYPPPPQTWAPPPYPPPSHYPPPSNTLPHPAPQPNVYPPPPPQQHWGYHRPHGYHPHW